MLLLLPTANGLLYFVFVRQWVRVGVRACRVGVALPVAVVGLLLLRLRPLAGWGVGDDNKINHRPLSAPLLITLIIKNTLYVCTEHSRMLFDSARSLARSLLDL
jgi:hypothetical protein